MPKAELKKDEPKADFKPESKPESKSDTKAQATPEKKPETKTQDTLSPSDTKTPETKPSEKKDEPKGVAGRKEPAKVKFLPSFSKSSFSYVMIVIAFTCCHMFSCQLC